MEISHEAHKRFKAIVFAVWIIRNFIAIIRQAFLGIIQDFMEETPIYLIQQWRNMQAFQISSYDFMF